MPESASEKSKRRFIEHLQRADWCFQFSFIYTGLVEETKANALEDGKRLRKYIGRKYKSQPFLYRLALVNREIAINHDAQAYVNEETGEIIGPERVVYLGYGETAYHTFFTTAKISNTELAAIAEKYCKEDVVLRYRKRNRDQLDQYAASVKKQKPHNLKRFFGDQKINRFSFLNMALFEEES